MRHFMDGGKYTSSWRLRKKAVLCGKKVAVLEGEKEAFFWMGRNNSVLREGDMSQFLEGDKEGRS